MSEATKDQRADALVASYERAGYARVVPAILQPAEPFLDLSGEDIRRRMYLISDPAGSELCLRPDLTIPVALDYLASPGTGRPATFCYLGPIFRQREDGPAEFLQAGIESFGRADTAAADAETLALALEATALYGLAEPAIRMGDVALFAAFIGALDLSPAWKRRLVKDFNRKTNFAQDLDRLVLARPNGAPEYQGVLAALANADPKAAHALVTDLLSIAGITAVGGRSVGEIADRFLEQAALGAGSALPGDTRRLIERFLAIGGDPDEASAELRALARRREARARAGARPVRKPHRLPGRARRRPARHPFRDRVRPRPRLLHRHGVRAARAGRQGDGRARRRRPLRRAAAPASAPRARCRRSASRSGSTRLVALGGNPGRP